MPDEQSGSIGVRRNLTVRLGATLQPQFVTPALRSGQQLNAEGCKLVTAIYAQQSDEKSIEQVNFRQTELAPGAYRLDLSKELVAKLVELTQVASTLPSPSLGMPATRLIRARSRVLWWTCMFEDVDGASHPLRYGSLTIRLGAS